MKSLLFISNGNKPNAEEYNYIGEETLTNFSIPIVKAAIKLGYGVTVGINRKNAEKITCAYPVKFYNAEIYRNPFNFFEVYKAYKNAVNELKQHDYRVIHCNTPIGGVIGRLAGKRMAIPTVIYTAHGFHFYKGAPLINRILYKTIERLLAHWTDVIITINQEDYEAAQKFHLRNGGKVYKVNGVGINLASFEDVKVDNLKKRREFGLKESDIICISAGDLISRKNYACSIEAIYRANNPDLHYLICGEGPEKSSLISMVNNYGLMNNIHFLGFRSDIKELMKISDIFLFTSLQEGLPRSLMEAMASGLPCVASDIRGNVDLLTNGEGGFLLDPKDIYKISDALNKLASNSELRNKMSKSNLETIKDYDSKEVEKAIYSLYCNELNTERVE